MQTARMSKVVILAGGKGTRISEETKTIPKPMIRVGDKPILHHIMSSYISQGHNEFIIPVGYKSEIIYGYFLSLQHYSMRDKGDSLEIGFSNCVVTLVKSGMDTQTGGRLKRVEEFIKDDFFFTYGDGLSDVDVLKVMEKHKEVGAVATISAVRPDPRFGSLLFDGNGKVVDFGEKQEHLRGWINGGFAVLSPDIFSYIDSDECNLEKDVYPKLAYRDKMYAVTHDGFWKCVDTIRDLEEIEDIYNKQGTIWLK